MVIVMLTEMTINYENIQTKILILNKDEKYDFLTYNYKQKTFIDCGFTKESFKIKKGSFDIYVVKDLIERLHLLFTHYTLEKLMYTNELEDFIGIKLTFSHIPEEYSFL